MSKNYGFITNTIMRQFRSSARPDAGYSIRMNFNSEIIRDLYPLRCNFYRLIWFVIITQFFKLSHKEKMMRPQPKRSNVLMIIVCAFILPQGHHNLLHLFVVTVRFFNCFIIPIQFLFTFSLFSGFGVVLVCLWL